MTRKAWEQLDCEIFSILARSPDLNPIENIFHIVRRHLREDALSKKIMKEIYAQFSARVAETIQTSDTDVINKTIESMEKRIEDVIHLKRGRTKY